MVMEYLLIAEGKLCQFIPSKIQALERIKHCRPIRCKVLHPIRMNADGGISPQQRITVPPDKSSEHDTNVVLTVIDERDVVAAA
jgi:hypothetical protein